MPPKTPGNDFAPKILVLGRTNTTRSIMLEALLEESQSRFGVESAGIEPARHPDPGALKVLEERDLEEVDLGELQSDPISSALNDHIQLVVYLSSGVKTDGPIIATAGDKVTLEVPDVDPDEADSLEPYRAVLKKLENDVLDRIIEEELGLTA